MAGANERLRRPDRGMETWTSSMLEVGSWLEGVEDQRDFEGEGVAGGEVEGSGTEGTEGEERSRSGSRGGGGGGGEAGGRDGNEGEGESHWRGGGATGGIEARYESVSRGEGGVAGVRGGPGSCSRCGRPWAAHDNGDGGGGGSGDTSSIQEDLHFTVKLSDTDTGAITSPHAEASGTGSGSYSSQQGWGAREGDQDAEQQSGNHDDGSSNDQGWFRTAVYGLEGLNRLRSPRGNDTTSDQGQRLYSTPKTTICGACGRDRQLEHDWRYLTYQKCLVLLIRDSYLTLRMRGIGTTTEQSVQRLSTRNRRK